MNDNVFYTLLALVPAMLNAGILVFLLFFLPKNKTTNIFGVFVLALLLWQVQDVIVRTCETEETARFWDAMLCIGWIGLGPLSFHFACRYVGLRSIYGNRLCLLLIYVPFLVLLLLHVHNPKLEFVRYEKWGWISTPKGGSADGFLRYYISAFVILSVSILFIQAYRLRQNKKRRLQVFLVAFGMLIPTLQGVITQVVLPLALGMEEIPLTSTFMTFFSIATIISLSKYQLFNLSETLEVETIMEHFTKVVIVLSPGGTVLYMNRFGTKLFEGGMKGLPTIENLFPTIAAFHEFREQVVTPALTGIPVNNYGCVLQTVQHEEIDVLISAEPIRNNNQIQGILIIGNDVTEKLKTLNALKQSIERYNLVSRATNDMVWDWNIETGEVYRNREGWKKIFGTDILQEISTGNCLYQKQEDKDHGTIEWLKQELLHSNKDHFEKEFCIRRADGDVAFVLDRCFIVRDESGIPKRVIGAAQDITEKRKAELILKEEQLARHKEITQAVISAQEKERQFIGAELHDNVNQILTSASLFVDLASAAQAQDRGLFLDKTKEIIDEAISEIRKLSHSLIAPSLNGDTLQAAILNLIDMTRKGGLEIRTEFDSYAEELISGKLKLTIYRIIQEQFNNIVKYAKAKKVTVKLTIKDKELMLHIVDDGVGFDPSKKAQGAGLTNIKTRSQLHNGEMEILTRPKQGCTLIVRIPLQMLEAA